MIAPNSKAVLDDRSPRPKLAGNEFDAKAVSYQFRGSRNNPGIAHRDHEPRSDPAFSPSLPDAGGRRGLGRGGISFLDGPSLRLSPRSFLTGRERKSARPNRHFMESAGNAGRGYFRICPVPCQAEDVQPSIGVIETQLMRPRRHEGTKMSRRMQGSPLSSLRIGL